MQPKLDTHPTRQPISKRQSFISNIVTNAPKEPQSPNTQRKLEIDELDKAIGRLNRSINASSYQLLILIREFDERAGWLKWSFTDGVAWLKWRCDLSEGSAREKLRMAHALKELPLISNAFSAGNLSYSKVRVMTRVATSDNEGDLIEMARRTTVRHLTEHCKQRSNAKQASTAAALNAQNARAFRVWQDTTKGTMHFSIEIPIEEGELVEKAIEKAASQLTMETGLTEPTTVKEPSWTCTQADAFVDVMRGYLSGVTSSESSDRTSSSSADNHLVMIHVDESALINHESDQTPIENPDNNPDNSTDNSTDNNSDNSPDNNTSQYPIETVRRLCCDSSIVPIIENAKGEPLNVGRRVRTITTAIRRALWARDRGCSFPGCNHKRFVDAHHIKHWADGGKTEINNLVLLCSSHHKLVHEGGYQINRDESGEIFFRRPDGKAIPHSGFHRDDWVDYDDNRLNDQTNTPSINTRPNARAFDSVNCAKEPSAIYCLH